jgi:hypothetical protein
MSPSFNTELIKPCKARSGIEKIRLTINAVVAKSLNTRGRPFLGCSTLAFHLAIASSSIQKVSEPRLIKAWFIASCLLFYSEVLTRLMDTLIGDADQICGYGFSSTYLGNKAVLKVSQVI